MSNTIFSAKGRYWFTLLMQNLRCFWNFQSYELCLCMEVAIGDFLRKKKSLSPQVNFIMAAAPINALPLLPGKVYLIKVFVFVLNSYE